jgi:hypothetical protein
MDLERSIQQLEDSITKKSMIRTRQRNLRDETMDFEFSKRRFDESSLSFAAFFVSYLGTELMLLLLF